MPQKELKILQLNANRSRLVMDEALAAARQNSCNILVISEPNLASLRNMEYFTDDTNGAVLVDVTGDLGAADVRSSTGFVVATTVKTAVISLYISPNVDMEIFTAILDNLRIEIRNVGAKEIILCGDFNSKNQAWGGLVTDRRGRLLHEVISGLDLICANRRDCPTYSVPGRTESFIDFCFVNDRAHRILREWKICDDVALSDHKSMIVTFGNSTGALAEVNNRPGVSLREQENFRKLFVQELSRRRVDTPEELMAVGSDLIQTLGAKSKGRRRVYWWTPEIEELRRRCWSARRKFQRAGRGTAEGRYAAGLAYRAVRKDYKRAIWKAKRSCWEALCEDLNTNVWGQAFTIVMKRFGRRIPKMTGQFFSKVTELVFPTGEYAAKEYVADGDIPLITREEVTVAIRNMGRKKSPGPDGIPAEYVAVMFNVDPQRFVRILNQMLLWERIPDGWKVARLVLLRKEGKEREDPSGYRPICLVNSLAKVLEKVIVERMWAHVELTGSISASQYGFKRGTSTVDAVKKIMGIVEEAAAGSRRRRQIPVVVCLDVRNAFNSLEWTTIFQVLERKRFPTYLIRLIQEYFVGRKVIGVSEEGEVALDITRGVPQGSVVGPLLWNLAYNDVLEIKYPDGVEPVAFADDLALAIVGQTEEEVVHKTTESVKMVSDWMEGRSLKLAIEKTQIVVMTGRRRMREMVFNLNGVLVRPTDSVKYLGVWLDKSRTFKKHALETVKRAENTANKLKRLMVNIGGPVSSKRKLLAQVIDSLFLYAAPVWRDALEVGQVRGIVESCRRRVALRVISGYRTVSLDAALVLSGLPPIELIAEVRAKVYYGVKKEQAYEEMYALWQAKWDESRVGRWTHELIPDVKQWTKRVHGELSFHLTEFFTGHGPFRKYLFKIGKTTSEECRVCDVVDTPAHTVFHCTRWTGRRQPMLVKYPNISPENVLEYMYRSKEDWRYIKTSIEDILSEKNRDP